MPKIQYKEKCKQCRKNFVLVTSRSQYTVCYECQQKEMKGEITDPMMKKFFDIPDQYYEQNSFLRNIKINYLKYGQLSEKQIEAFKKVVKDLDDQQEQIEKLDDK